VDEVQEDVVSIEEPEDISTSAVVEESNEGGMKKLFS